MTQFFLSGRIVRTHDLTPVSHIQIQLHGPAQALAQFPQIHSVEQPFTWNRILTDFAGHRWNCWETHIQHQVQGITWADFRDDVLRYNPHLNDDGRLFQADKSYFIPQNDPTPRAYAETTTDSDGAYYFILDDKPDIYELRVENDTYERFVLPLAINGDTTQPVTLVPKPKHTITPEGSHISSNVRSARSDYANLPTKTQQLISLALGMLGDDAQVFDMLPPELRRLCYGERFLNNPNHFHHKDIVCADLISIALKGAQITMEWPSSANPHMADYYHPDRGNNHLIEIHNPHDWRPGDILVYGHGATNSRAGHVNLYVGIFTGTDHSGKTYRLSDNVEIVEASIDFISNGKEIGTGITGATLQRCLQGKRGYTWVRHVRLRELATG